MNRLPRSLMTIVCLWGLSGCSWIFVKTVDNSPPPARRYCTNTLLLPVLDGIGTLTSASAAVNRMLGRQGGDIFWNGLSAVALGLSSYYGFTETRRCQTLKVTGRDPGSTGAWQPSDGLVNPIVGCGSDKDCKGTRVCRSGRCVDR